MTSLDRIDRAIILHSQEGLPLSAEPYHAVAEHVGVPVEEVMERMRRMLRDGVIRRIAAVPNHYALGYRFNGMTVWDVADEDVVEAGERVAALPFVSHCYQRPRHPPQWPYNLFAMVHARDRLTAEQKVARIAEALGGMVRGHEVLFSRRILKKTGMRISNTGS